MDHKSTAGIRSISIILLILYLLATVSAIDVPVKCTCNCRGNTIQAAGNTNSQCSYSCGAICGGSTQFATGSDCSTNCTNEYCGDTSVMDCSSTPVSSSCESGCEASCTRACDNNTSTYTLISTIQLILFAIAAVILALCGLKFITSDEAEQRDEAKKCIIFVIMIFILLGIAKPLVYAFYTIGGITGPGTPITISSTSTSVTSTTTTLPVGPPPWDDRYSVWECTGSTIFNYCENWEKTTNGWQCTNTGSLASYCERWEKDGDDWKCTNGGYLTEECEEWQGESAILDWVCPTTAGSQKDVPCAVWDWPLFDVLDCNNGVIQACDDDLKVVIDENIFDDAAMKAEVLNNSNYDGAVDEIFSELKAFYLAPDPGCGDCEGGKRVCSGGILCDDKKPSDLLSGAEECGNCADWSTTILSLLRTIGVPQERVYEVSFQTSLGPHAVTVYESDGGEWRVLDLLNLNEVKSIDDWRYIPGFCKCTQYYTNDYSSNKFDDKSMFNNFCTDDSGQIGGVPAASATQLCDPTPDPCNPSGELTASISEPSDGDSFAEGDRVQFLGSASGGTEPYTYGWSSSIDGDLGSNDLGLLHYELSKDSHDITLYVADSGTPTKTGSEEISISVGDPECRPWIVNGDHDDKIDIVFIRAIDIPHIDFALLIDDLLKDTDAGLFTRDPVSSNTDKFNVYYYSKKGVVGGGASPDKCTMTLPDDYSTYCSFADTSAFIHDLDCRNKATLSSMNFPMPGSKMTSTASEPGVLTHESGHAILGLSDEYYDSQVPYQQTSDVPNVWSSQASCDANRTAEGWTEACEQICDGTCVDFWCLDYDGVMKGSTYNTFSPAAKRRINWIFGHYS